MLHFFKASLSQSNEQNICYRAHATGLNFHILLTVLAYFVKFWEGILDYLSICLRDTYFQVFLSKHFESWPKILSFDKKFLLEIKFCAKNLRNCIPFKPVNQTILTLNSITHVLWTKI